jgi:hypothetical protein
MSVFGQARLRYPPFREAHQGLQMRDSVTLGGRPYHFSHKLTERRHIQHLLGEPLLQLGVLLLKRLQSLRLGDFHAALFGLPVVKRRVENPVLAAQVGRLRTHLLLSQNTDDLLFRKSLLLHSSVLKWAGL